MFIKDGDSCDIFKEQWEIHDWKFYLDILNNYFGKKKKKL